MRPEFQVTGISVAGPPPILPTSLSLGRGLNVVYGRNGTGKTLLLKEIARTVESSLRPIQDRRFAYGRPTDYTEIDGHLGSAPGLTAMLEGGIHVREPLELDDLSRSPIGDTVKSWWDSKPWVPATLRNITSGEEVQIGEPTELAELGLTPKNVGWFLAQGCWMLSRGVLYLCDPDPFGGSPLAHQWKKSQQWWDSFEERFAAHVDMDAEHGNGLIAYDDGLFDPLFPTRRGTREVREVVGRWHLQCEEWIERAIGPQYGAYLALHRAGMNYAVRADTEDSSNLRQWEFNSSAEFHLSQQVQAGLPLLPPVDGWMSRSEQRLPTPILGIGRLQGSHVANVNMVDASLASQLADIGRELAGQLDFVAWDERDAARQLAISAETRELLRQELPTYQPSEPPPIPVLDVALAEITSAANETLADLFDPNPIITLTRNTARSWNSDHPPVLTAANTSRDGNDFGLEELGTGHQRWVRFAINHATNAYRPSTKEDRHTRSFSVNVIDEPELALHDSAVTRIIEYLRRAEAPAIVATHSSELIAQADMSGTVHEITLDEQGFIKIHENRPNPTGDEMEAARWGMSLSRLRSLIRTLVVVEGPQDEAIIEELLADDLRSSAAAIIPMYGSKEHDAVALVKSHCEQIFATSAINLVVVLDNSSHQLLADTIQQVSQRPTQQQQLGFLQGQRNRPEFQRSREMSTYLALLTAAIRYGKLDRIHLCGFAGRDIANLLPISFIAPQYSTWEEVEADFLTSVGRDQWRSGDGRRFKDFVNSRGGQYTTPGLRTAAQRLAEQNLPLSADLQSLRDTLARL